VQKKQFNKSIQQLSEKYTISNRTLQRYFGQTTSFSSKQALQTMRIREAVKHLTSSPATFNLTAYGYYDYSHFYKDMNRFFEAHKLANVRTYRRLFEMPKK
jgi:transcriptional regulator GlxA family with amidase domain